MPFRVLRVVYQAAAQRCCAVVQTRPVPSVPVRCCCDTIFLRCRSADWCCAADLRLPLFLPCRAKQFRRDSALLRCCADGIPTENVRPVPAAYSARPRRPCRAAPFLRDDTAHRALFFLPRALHWSLASPHDPAHVWCRAARRSCAWSSAAFRLQQARLVGMRLPSFRRQTARYQIVPQKSARRQSPDRVRGLNCFAVQTCCDDSRSHTRAH